MELLTALTSPIYAGIASTLVATTAIFTSNRKPSIKSLIIKIIAYVGIGLILSLAYTIYAMVQYEATTGYSAGNGPLGWIFYYAPLSITCGIIVATLHWVYSNAI